MAKPTGRILLALLVLRTFVPAQVHPQTCTALGSGAESRLIAYLTKARQNEPDKDCVVLAIRGLGNKKSLRATELLINYLDYKRPLTNEEQAGVWIRTPSRGELYPAVTSLFSIGTGAIPSLLQAIANSERSSVKSDNAIYTLMLIHREDPVAAVKALGSSAATNTGIQAERLSGAAEDAAKLCLDDLRPKCMDAILGR